MAKIKKEDALKYHSENRPGKIEVIPTTPHATQRDLALAYSPGVAEPCLEIEKNKDDAYKYTAKGNLVGVISNGTAVLGLGNIGALAGKPVMEGKGLLFKIFGDIDVFDIELDTEDIDKFVETVKIIAPTFGGINLEDIKAPECFEIEKRLKDALDIPIMHDDQHGTAIITASGVVNAVQFAKKKLKDIKVVISGAGAAAMACTNLIISLGVQKKNVVMCDSKGVINKDRKDINKYKKEYITLRKIKTLGDAMKDADLFLGLSVKDTVTKEMVKSMAKNPIIFAMANPDPEITYEDAKDAREDVLMATGRSDYPNQVNNVLGFPFIFRGALDVRATGINEEMKIAAVHAIADLAREDVPEEVSNAYNTKHLVYGRDYFIPKPMDPRLITKVSIAVAKAAMDSGIAKKPIEDFEKYEEELIERTGSGNKLVRRIYTQAKANPKKVIFADAENYNVLRAAEVCIHEGFAEPILLGQKAKILDIITEYKLDDLLESATIIEPYSVEERPRRQKYAQYFYEKRKRKGVRYRDANEKMYNRNYFGMMMIEHGEADAFITGYATKYSEALSPILEVIRCSEEVKNIAGMYVVKTKNRPLFFADTTVNKMPSSQTLVETTLTVARTIKWLGEKPIISMLAYSNFGATEDGSPERVRKAIEILHREHQDIIIDGEMQANFALNTELRDKHFPFTKLKGKKVNTLIFPNLSSGNIAYKMMQEIGEAEVLGPILCGTRRPVHIVQLGSSVREIVNMAAIAVVDAQNPSNKSF
ncbi:MAG: NADP-dependent malic enzyme [Bacteroidales bacterium]|nr:NADP-dependent malic enzyme [Bacteroidales bacterium]